MNQDNDKEVHITQPDVEDYALYMTSDESDEISQLIKQSEIKLEYVDMLSGKLIGQLLKLLIKSSGAQRVLEIGTFTGYSALMMAEALPDEGEIVTLEMNQLYQEIAADHFRQFKAGKIITLMKGDARELIKDLEGYFDFVFLDADKISYSYYYNFIIDLLKPGGLLAADNVLWSGKVLNPNDPKSKALYEFNNLVKNDGRVEQVLLPVRDGFSIIRKK